MRFVIIENGKVVNAAIADAPLGSDWIQSDTAGIGDAYNAGSGQFTRPQPAAEPTSRDLPKLDYLKRFTQQERIDIRNMGKVSDLVNDYIELMNAAVTVHLDDPDTVSGLAALEQVGAIGPGRAAEIRS